MNSLGKLDTFAIASERTWSEHGWGLGGWTVASLVAGIALVSAIMRTCGCS